MGEKGLGLPYTSDLAVTGVAETLRSLVHPSRQLFFGSFDAMRMRVANNIVSLALRRFLVDQEIPHHLAAPISFTEADQLDLMIGGRRCIPTVQLCCGNQEGEDAVYLPDLRGASLYRDVDLYLFYRLKARVTRSRDETDEAIFAGLPACLVHQMPEIWASPDHWDGLDKLAVKTDASDAVRLALHGLDSQRVYTRYDLEALPRKRETIESGLFTLGAVCAAAYPAGPVGIFSPTLDDLHLIHPYAWGNIWVYAEQIEALGYITKAAFDQQAEKRPGPEMVSANPCLGEMDYLCLPLAALTPLEDLFSTGTAVGGEVNLEIIDSASRPGGEDIVPLLRKMIIERSQ